METKPAKRLQLPTKPDFTEHSDVLSTELSSEPLVASSSTQLLCGSCNLLPAKYTCPGCRIRTCSLPCSKRHKENTGCTGKRNRAVYVPMNEYTYGRMVDDYAYLEEVGRKVGEWGDEIVKGGYTNPGTTGAGGGGNYKGRMRGRGRGRGVFHGGQGQSRRDVLKLELEEMKIDMDLLPQGMEKRKLNQSTWDPKTRTGYLTIEFKIYKPKDSFAPASMSADPPFTLLTHRNTIDKGLLTSLRNCLNGLGSKSKNQSSAYPDWVRRLVFSSDDGNGAEDFTNPHFIVLTRFDHLNSSNFEKPKYAYQVLDPTQPLSITLQHTHFVEYPTIEVWEELDKTIVDKEGNLQQEEESQRPKRRKMNVKAGKKAISGLIGAYGSSSEDEEKIPEDESESHQQNGLAALGDYSGSEDEKEIEPAALLELMRKAQAGGDSWALEGNEDEVVDWGDIDGEENEEETDSEQ
ncbi:hypothetical protein CPB83DRAFT_843172 [Crepidotus variabilis]|uniref:HIT-type domain-containing protein n=1 Tax=Crepidotus variabilis TaxID=179855 RepID=A0A9P6JVX1_9AGAR|nr:hypothetical protein CPB83DRAFT_843172 [Crepidotus variabilis]